MSSGEYDERKFRRKVVASFRKFVREGAITGKCGRCNDSLTPKEALGGECPRCGFLDIDGVIFTLVD